MLRSKKIHCTVCNKEIKNKKREGLLDQFQMCKSCSKLLSANQHSDYSPYDDLGFA